MQLTPNYRLRKPDGTDPVDVQDLNDNMDVLDAEVVKKLDKTGDASNVVNKFSQEGTRANLSAGEKLSISLGKIMKWFADLKAVAFSGNYADLTGRPTIPAGGIADASKIIDNIDDIAANTQAGYMAGALALKQVNSDLGGLKFKEESGVKYIRGADAVWVPFNGISYIANLKGKYGTGNNAYIAATPEEIQGYELALYGFTNLYASGAMHVAAISADNNRVQAGSQYGSVISCTYGGYYVKVGTPYMVKEHALSKVSTVNLHNDVPGYRLVGGVLHFSGYTSSQTGGDAVGSLTMNNTSDTMTANVSFRYSEVKTSAKLLYLPG